MNYISIRLGETEKRQQGCSRASKQETQMRGCVLVVGELWGFVSRSHGGSEAGVWSSSLHVLKLTCVQAAEWVRVSVLVSGLEFLLKPGLPAMRLRQVLFSLGLSLSESITLRLPESNQG